MEWNERQKEAIKLRNKNILVSASAGSGKTAVLSERIVEIVLNEGVDIDKFVVVTFTRLAASEMKTRIAKKLEKAKSEYPDKKEYIEEQLILLERANISTLDSFNISLLRDYFYLIDIEPNFKVIDDIDSAIMSDEILYKVFERYYKEKDPLFIELISMYSDARTDEGLKRLILSLYNNAINMPNPDKALSSMLESYDAENVEEGIYYNFFKDYALKILMDYKTKLEEYKDLHTSLMEDYTLICNLIESINKGYEETYKILDSAVFSQLRWKKTDEIDEKTDKVIKSFRDSYKKFIRENLKDRFFKSDKENFISETNFMKKYLEKIITITKEYKEELFDNKKKNNNYDFNDLAHLVIKLLVNEDGSYSNVAKNLKSNFEYIIVDEYQDVNEIQETILKAIARDNEKSNMFMVGDVKQSIYRFRKADPEIFTNKYNSFKDNENPYDTKIDLNQNFRSRKEVLDSINFIFEKIMRKDIGGIEYDDEMALKYGEQYNDEKGYDYKTEMIIMPKIKKERTSNKELLNESNDNEEDTLEEIDLPNARSQAKFIAGKIKELIENKTEILDDKNYRFLKYSDIAVLYRSCGDDAKILFEELKRSGIPAVISKQDNFMDEYDVKLLIAMLKVIDNPYDNISFVTTMYSDYYQFTPEELMKLKQRNIYKTAFYDICTEEYKKKDVENSEEEKLNPVTLEKVIKVIDTYNFLKDYSLKNSLYDLTKEIYNLFNQEKYFLGFMNMKNKVDNMNLLLKFADKFEKSGSKNIYDFISLLDKVEETGKTIDMKMPMETGNAVNIMTIHKSKGLEYPVVFMPSLDKNFNKSDIMSKTLMDKNLGYVSKYINLKKAYQKTNLFFETVKAKILLDNIAEEMRVFYVAMTRAKEKLYLVASYSESENGDKYDGLIHNNKMDYSKIVSAQCPLDLFMPCIKEIDSEKFIHTSYIENDLTDNEEIENISPMKKLFNEIKDEINNDDKYVYKYEKSTKIKKKVSVTEVKKKHMEELEQEELEQEEYELLDSIKEDDSDKVINEKTKKYESEILRKLKREDVTKLSGAEKGTIMHKLVKIINDTDIDKEFDRLIKNNIFNKEELDQIDKEKIITYLNSDTYKRIENSNFVKREMPFMMRKRAKEIYKEIDNDDYVIIQGIIDCIFEEDDKIVILDYKTDKVFKEGIDKEERIKELIKNYKIQLDLYEEAVKMIYGKEIKEKVLYLFDSGDTVNVDE